MSSLRDRLAGLGLAQYADGFTAEGFDSWETVLDITESDLQLGVKLGHRRKLQRAIAESRGQSSDRPLPNAPGRSASVEESYRSEDSATEGKNKRREALTNIALGIATKRKYRRHPKPDENAPERPPSAYVIFSNHTRESLKGQDLTFTEIAKIVGERWQVLPVDERENCERQANNAKDKYYAQMAAYKKTPEYKAYQHYLDDFKAKHAIPVKEGKRSRRETDTSTSAQSNNHDQQERTTQRRSSPMSLDLPGAVLQSGESSPPIGPLRLPAGPSHASKPSSPATRSFSGFSSPRLGDPFSPVHASPRSAGFSKEAFDILSSSSRGRRMATDANIPHGSLSDARCSTSRTPPSYPRGSHHATSAEPRRLVRETMRIPRLTHEDTTLSSESSHSNHSIPLTGPMHAFSLEPAKASRILPQPIPVVGLSTSSLDRPGLPLPSLSVPCVQFPSDLQDYRTQGPLAVLIRAGELVSREADSEAMQEDGNE